MDRLTGRPDMTSAVYHGRKASTQANKQKMLQYFSDDTRPRKQDLMFIYYVRHVRGNCILKMSSGEIV